MDSYIQMIIGARRQRERAAEAEHGATDVDRLLGAATYLATNAATG